MRIWILAARPKTLIASVSPVLIGSVLAYRDQDFSFLWFFLIVFSALAIQIGTNFANDYFDCIKGADTKNRKGPTRVTAAGLVSHRAIKRAIWISFSFAALLGVFLIAKGGWCIALLVALSIVLGILYTGGPFPLGYLGLGDCLVFLFFGPIATSATYWILTDHFSSASLVAGIAPGALSSAILVVNNLRDIEEDRLAHKKTLPVRFGRGFGKGQYIGSVALALATPLCLPFTGALVANAILLPAFFQMRSVVQNSDPLALNPILGKTAGLLALYTLLFCAALLLI